MGRFQEVEDSEMMMEEEEEEEEEEKEEEEMEMEEVTLTPNPTTDALLIDTMTSSWRGHHQWAAGEVLT
ncbi:hypothetical protein EYF80_056871 [Liparis tanakae]|uniref:Uncharacterized protein n=1 Tax=Liparis tanakae TaxID=230148 RepID=A0A4Z2EVX7_9TELE|nr:hypothetical protein EYF80_056871 [Liparis tanakae]